MSSVRYRTGLDRTTGQVLVGWPHCRQSLDRILRTLKGEIVMLYDLGSELVSHIGEELDAITIPAIYRDTVVAIHLWEPEFRVKQLGVVRLERTGGLGLEIRGNYFPEGRFGNYRLIEPADGTFVLTRPQALGARPT